MRTLLLLLLAAGMASTAGDPANFYIWTSAELKALPTTLAPKLNPTTQMTSQPLAAPGNYTFAAVLRKTSGTAEVHEKQADIFFITAGEGTLILGGTVVDPKTTQPNEIRGSGISGGLEKKVAAGDVVTVPAKLPHQMKVAAGKEIAYMAIKVAQ